MGGPVAPLGAAVERGGMRTIIGTIFDDRIQLTLDAWRRAAAARCMNASSISPVTRLKRW